MHHRGRQRGDGCWGGGNVEERTGHTHTNVHTSSIDVHTDTRLSASYQSSLMKAAIRSRFGPSITKRQWEERGTEGEKEVEREDMACLREEESDGMSSGTVSVKRGEKEFKGAGRFSPSVVSSSVLLFCLSSTAQDTSEPPRRAIHHDTCRGLRRAKGEAS